MKTMMAKTASSEIFGANIVKCNSRNSSNFAP